MVLVNIKWNKVTFEKVKVDPSAGVLAFKSVIQELTDVPIERQKLMSKGLWIGVLKDDLDLSSITITENAQITLIGTADTVSKPQKVTTFIEDLSVAEIAKQGIVSPAGLNNLGNTCYLNATVQCLRKIPELRMLLNRAGNNAQLAKLLGSLFQELDSSTQGITPLQFVNTIRMLYPQFAEMKQGRYMQQDAEEFYNSLSSALEHAAASFSFDKDLTELLHVTLEEKITCKECNLEPEIKRLDQVNKLVCNIQGGGSSTVNIDHMIDGIKLALNETIEKRSNVLDRDALWMRQQRLASTPKYLCIQFMRFFWKATPDNRDHTGVKCKILRAVSFPEKLDIFELCNEQLQSALLKRRDVDVKIHDSSNKKPKLDNEPISSSSASAGQIEEDDAAMAVAMELSSGEEQLFSPQLEVGFKGIYELHAVVTHQGRSADSGHYMAYARDAPGSALWWCYDDAKVTETKIDEILKLSGGGDRDIAYLCFYRMKTD